MTRSRRPPRRAGADAGARVLVVPETWATSGACAVPADAPHDLKHATWALFDDPVDPYSPRATAERLATVRGICDQCPVLAACRAFGMRQPHGFYGGMTPEERAARRRGDERAHEAIMAEVREAERNQRAQGGLVDTRGA